MYEGARRSVYVFAANCHALYHSGMSGIDYSDPILFTNAKTTSAITRDTRSASTTIPSRNLNIRLVFWDCDNAMSFQNEMDAADGFMPSTVTRELEPITVSSMMVRVSIKDYKANALDSPLAESEGSGSDTSGITQLPPNDPLCEYQTIEKPSRIIWFFRMHLVTKKSTDTKKVGDLQDNSMAASWPMYQCFHGIRTLLGIPLVAIDASQEQPDEEKTLGMRKRRRVDLDVQFFDANTDAEMHFKLNTGSARIEGMNFAWRTCVWVGDAKTFMKNLKLKSDDTKQKWKELDEL